MPPEEIYNLRQAKSKPVLKEFKAWLENTYPKTPPRGLLGQAIGYALSQWIRLERYIENGCLTIDNNLVENAIRPFAVGRKNWLFSGNPTGAHASSNLYSLIETAKANGIEPYNYLKAVLEKLPMIEAKKDYGSLLPLSQ